MNYKNISNLDFLWGSLYRIVMGVFAVNLIVAGAEHCQSHPTEEIPWSGMIFMGIILTGSLYELVQLVAHYWKQEIECNPTPKE